MTLTLNGESRNFSSEKNSMSLTSLLAELGFEKVPVLIEHNGTALRPREHTDLEINDGDQLEIIRIVAGG